MFLPICSQHSGSNPVRNSKGWRNIFGTAILLVLDQPHDRKYPDFRTEHQIASGAGDYVYQFHLFPCNSRIS